ncbi:hypothetical protein HGO34_08140 [Agrobacterium vitis]|uniref:LydA holin phage, holin superfamily III n=1 Tax=Agrobacterium vitis TaxID=373 RepID=A0AAE4WBH4_AGRVI|nr:phage holin family protein [Agrobacterium vitis]MCF1501992.1 hypothetical protein [Allorhizobium sp. Av2]MCM2439684.1 hypothetical protein [Agrobacterium vitis]MUZ57419.1 hypothetical protein [Agrobacterium vitis]MVA69317.1 hypothetical protein [Agrobacterium vitis]MVA86753.1 hypothetical protein [Agrobacterium vitis]
MSEKFSTVAEVLTAWFGGAGTTIIGAIMGRAMWHGQEVRRTHRRPLGPELLWELPIAISMALIGEGLAGWLDLGQPVATGLIAALAYLGPRGAEVLFMKWWMGRKPH